MRHLFYTNYQSGHSGLSNGIMSIENGVVLAFLTNRLLLLDGNLSPPANVVAYDGRVDNKNPSRITDLIDLPVPWKEPDEAELESMTSRELTDQHLMNSVFYLPGTVDIESSDALSFARGRKHWLCETEELVHTPVLRVSEDPIVLHEARQRNNLSFYSYFFYLDAETRRAAYQVLQRMQPKDPYAELAGRVAADLGAFNAVHMRRGDFKVTYGVTVLDRHPGEAIEALDNHFERGQRLVICTDERDDPFFEEIKSAYKDHVFIDHHILDNYEKDFFALPCHDSITLAYLSQLIASESNDFIGTMTSTYTSIIQRYRGNRGLDERFKFLWNELPDPGQRAERGRHPVSDCVPLDQGIMIEEHEGPYSWNRYSQLLNPAWMREWPESFLTEEVLETGTLPDHEPLVRIEARDRSGQSEMLLAFEGVTIRVRSTVPGLGFRLSEMFHAGEPGSRGSVIAELEIDEEGGLIKISRNGRTLSEAESDDEVPGAVARALVPILTHARRSHSWLEGMAFRQAGRTIVYTGDLGDKLESIPDELCSSGWELLADEAIPIRSKNCRLVPFARCSWPKGASSRIKQSPSDLTAIVHGTRRLHSQDMVSPLSPSVGAAELIRESLDFRFDRERAVKRLCTVVEQVPVFELSFSQANRVPDVLGFLAEFDRPSDGAEGAEG
jgi:hypothetical protein